ncbi:ORFL321W.iORF5 [Human betaherpesvirus 5]|nr:ORFL321W.iORF5 [Human betaherpesvirus 5]
MWLCWKCRVGRGRAGRGGATASPGVGGVLGPRRPPACLTWRARPLENWWDRSSRT